MSTGSSLVWLATAALSTYAFTLGIAAHHTHIKEVKLADTPGFLVLNREKVIA